MSRSQADRHSLKRALAVSVALHLLCAPLFVASSTTMMRDASVAGAPSFGDETTTVAHLTIEHRPLRAHAVRRTAPPAPPHPAPARQVRPRIVAAAGAPGSTTSHAARERRERRSAASLTLATAAPERATVLQPLPLAIRPVPTPTPTPAEASVEPSVAPAVASPAAPSVAPSTLQTAAAVADRGIAVPAGGWGQSFERPLVADDAALADLRAKYRGARSVTIDVDESGHATRVVIAGLPDDVRAQLERSLLAMRYVPAECNGLRCTGTLQLAF